MSPLFVFSSLLVDFEAGDILHIAHSLWGPAHPNSHAGVYLFFGVSRQCVQHRAVATCDNIELTDEGVIDKFTVVHIPIPNNPIKPPFVVAHIRLNGADNAFHHLIGEVDNDKVKLGMKVKAVWRPESEWDYGLDNIRYFKPLGGEHD
jgi:uncharacterized OB-fold protein